MEKMCLWCKYFIMESRPEPIKVVKGETSYLDNLEFKWEFFNLLWFGCIRNPVEEPKSYKDICNKFEWRGGVDEFFTETGIAPS